MVNGNYGRIKDVCRSMTLVEGKRNMSSTHGQGSNLTYICKLSIMTRAMVARGSSSCIKVRQVLTTVTTIVVVGLLLLMMSGTMVTRGAS